MTLTVIQWLLLALFSLACCAGAYCLLRLAEQDLDELDTYHEDTYK